MCRKIESFETLKPYVNGFTTAEADLRWEICGVPLDIFFNKNGVKDKIASDVINVDDDVHKGTRKPGNRGQRRKKEKHLKKEYKKNYNRTHAPIRAIVRNNEKVVYVPYSSTYRYDWKKRESRLIRQNGKEICRNGYSEYSEYLEMLDDIAWDEYMEAQPCDKYYHDEYKEIWEEYQNNPYFQDPDLWEDRDWEYDDFWEEDWEENEDPIESENQETFMNLYVISHSYLYDFDYITKEYMVVGYNKAKDLYHKIFCVGDEDVALFTTKVNEEGIIVADECIMSNDEDEE